MDAAWIDLLNSDWHDPLGQKPPADRLDEASWRSSFATQWRLDQGLLNSARNRRRIKELRDAMRRCVEHVAASEPVETVDLEPVNRALAAQPVVTRLEWRGGRIVCTETPVGQGISAMLGRLAREFATFLSENDPTRIRMCENPDCRWVFYDASRSRTRRWCDDSCGNLIKVRRFRAKQGARPK